MVWRSRTSNDKDFLARFIVTLERERGRKGPIDAFIQRAIEKAAQEWDTNLSGSAAAVRTSKADAERIIRQLVPLATGQANIAFDEELGEVAVAVSRGNWGAKRAVDVLEQIRRLTGWRAIILWV